MGINRWVAFHGCLDYFIWSEELQYCCFSPNHLPAVPELTQEQQGAPLVIEGKYTYYIALLP